MAEVDKLEAAYLAGMRRAMKIVDGEMSLWPRRDFMLAVAYDRILTEYHSFRESGVDDPEWQR